MWRQLYKFESSAPAQCLLGQTDHPSGDVLYRDGHGVETKAGLAGAQECGGQDLQDARITSISASSSCTEVGQFLQITYFDLTSFSEMIPFQAASATRAECSAM
jgi:hypothetical protein